MRVWSCCGCPVRWSARWSCSSLMMPLPAGETAVRRRAGKGSMLGCCLLRGRMLQKVAQGAFRPFCGIFARRGMSLVRRMACKKRKAGQKQAPDQRLFNGAPGPIRTADTRFRRAVLYPLSYGGVCKDSFYHCRGMLFRTACNFFDIHGLSQERPLSQGVEAPFRADGFAASRYGRASTVTRPSLSAR